MISRSRFKKALAITIAAVLTAALAGCATYMPTPTSDPFTRELNHLYRQRRQDEAWMIASASAAAAGSLSATTFTTLGSLNDVGLHTARVGSILSYIIAALGAGSTIWSFIEYNKANSAYMETLKLETQYYNLVQPQH